MPNSALRYFPKPEQVRLEDRKILEGQKPPSEQEMDKNNQTVEPAPSAREKAAANRKRTHRYVWVTDGDFLKAVEVTIGINDNKYTEIVSGDLTAGTKVVTGVGTKAQTQSTVRVKAD